MPVQNGAHRVGDRLVEIVSFDEHGEEAGDRALAELPGALEYPRQQIEHRRRVGVLTGRLARGQSDLALRHGEARHRVHYQQTLFAMGAETLSHRQGTTEYQSTT